MRAVLRERSQTQGHALCHSTCTKSPTGSGDEGAEGGGGCGTHQRTRNVLDLDLGSTFVKCHQAGHLRCVYFMFVIFQ